MNNTETTNPDADLIESLGGPTKVAELLGFDKASGGAQRVQNWTTRGIPAAIKVKFPHLFLNGSGVAKPAAESVAAEAGSASHRE